MSLPQPPLTGRPSGVRPVAIAASLVMVVAALLVIDARPAASAPADAVVGEGSGRCLTSYEQPGSRRNPVDIRGCDGRDGQRWTHSARGELRVGDDLCLDARGGGRAPGTKVQTYPCHSGANQKWDLRADGTIVGVQSGLCVDVLRRRTTNGSAVALWPCHGGSNQQWATSEGGGGTGDADGSRAQRRDDGDNSRAQRRDAGGEARKGITGTNPESSNQPSCGQRRAMGITWHYSWTGGARTACDGVEFVPMITSRPYRDGKNGSPLTRDEVSRSLRQVADDGYDVVLGFNEPDKVDQAALGGPVQGDRGAYNRRAARRALELWPAITANPDIRVVSPSGGGGGSGLDFLRRFMTGAVERGYRVDAIAAHRYGTCDADSFGRWLGRVEALPTPGDPSDTPIWITEFGCNDGASPAEVARFLRDFDRMLEDHPRVERYAWFNGANPIVEGGRRSTIGGAYADLRSR